MGMDKSILFRISPEDHLFLSTITKEWQIPMSRWFDSLLKVLAENGQVRGLLREHIMRAYHAELARNLKNSSK